MRVMADERNKEKTAMDELLILYKKRVKDRDRFNNRWRQARVSSPIAAGNVLDKLFQKDPETLARIEESRALQAWPKYVGEAAAAVSQPMRVRGQKMIVSVPDPMWRQQLILARYQILKHYQRHFPRLKLKDIFFTA